MPWPKGKPRPDATSTRATRHFKTCLHCGEEKSLAEFPFAHWRKAWKRKKASDPTKYRDNCKDCTRYKNAVEADPDFPTDRGIRPGRPPKDRPHRKLTPREKKDRDNEYKAAIRRKTRIACLRYLARKGCETCGCKDPRVLEFDHLDPSKKRCSIATMISQGYSWANEKLRREIRKCRVLCANCHRLHTATQQGYYAHADVKRELDQLLEEAGLD